MTDLTCRAALAEERAMLDIAPQALCMHRWKYVPQIDLQNPGRVMPPVQECSKCGAPYHGHYAPKFGTLAAAPQPQDPPAGIRNSNQQGER